MTTFQRNQLVLNALGDGTVMIRVSLFADGKWTTLYETQVSNDPVEFDRILDVVHSGNEGPKRIEILTGDEVGGFQPTPILRRAA